MPISVLLVTTELGLGGAERIVVDIATGLDRARFSPAVAALDGRGCFAKHLRDAGIPVTDLGARSAWDAPRTAWALRKLVRTFAPHIVHAHLFHADILARMAVPRGVPIVATTHIAEARPLPWRFRLDRWTGSRVTCRTAVSTAAARFHAQRLGLSPEHIKVIPNGIDLAAFPPVTDRRGAKTALGLDPARPVAGALGRFDPQKGLDLFLDAAALAARTRPDIQWLLAGYGAEEARLVDRMRQPDLAGRVLFVREPASVAALYAAMNVYVFPSRYEGFGLTLVEAMASGCAPAASDIDTSREILCVCGKEDAGILVPGGTPAGLAHAVCALTADPAACANMGLRARNRAMDFSRERMLAGYAALYERIAEGR